MDKMDVSDMELVREYATRDSEQAFAALVKRHVDLVYSAALRQVRDPHLAEEITQAVFIVLAQKAKSLGRGTILSAWLCRTARYAAADALKAQHRRLRREQEAYMQSVSHESESDTWSKIAPLLDAAMAGLGKKEHDALALRFFEGRGFGELGAAMGISEAAAKMKVSRALEKLRKFFNRRGIVLSTALISTAVSAGSVHAAPVALKTSVAVGATQGAAVSGSTMALAKATLQFMAWAKVKTVLLGGFAVLAAAATTAVVFEKSPTGNWQVVPLEFDLVSRVSPRVQIVPSKFSRSRGEIFEERGPVDSRVIGLGASVDAIIRKAYGASGVRTIFPGDLPTGLYDYIANLPEGSVPALQREIGNVFGLTAKREARVADVLLLRFKNPNAPGLKQAHDWRSSATMGDEGYASINEPISDFAAYLENLLKIPIIDETGLKEKYGIDLKLSNRPGEHPDWAKMNGALIQQLGLELVPARRSLEMLIVERIR